MEMMRKLAELDIVKTLTKLDDPNPSTPFVNQKEKNFGKIENGHKFKKLFPNSSESLDENIIGKKHNSHLDQLHSHQPSNVVVLPCIMQCTVCYSTPCTCPSGPKYGFGNIFWQNDNNNNRYYQKQIDFRTCTDQMICNCLYQANNEHQVICQLFLSTFTFFHLFLY